MSDLFELTRDATYREIDEQFLIQALLTVSLRKQHSDLLELVEPEDFTSPARGHLWFLARKLIAKNDYILAPNLKKAHAQWGEMPIAAVLKQAENKPIHDFSEAKRAAEIVKDCSRRRTMVDAIERACQKILEQGGVGTYQEALDTLHDGLKGLHQGTDTVSVSLSEGIERFWDRQDAETATRVTVPSPWESLNAMLPRGGISAGQLVILGARPGVGKSVSMGQWALEAALSGYRTLYVSQEMPEEEVIDRMISCGSEVNYKSITDRNLMDWEREKIGEWQAKIDVAPLQVVSKGRVSLAELKAIVKTHIRSHGGLDLLVVDYLQKMKINSRRNMVEELGELAMGLKEMAMDLPVPLLTAAQLRRADNPTDLPRMEQLRSSGDIEQEADVVAMLHRDPSDRESTDYKIIVGKNRNGRTGGLDLFWDGSRQKIRDL